MEELIKFDYSDDTKTLSLTFSDGRTVCHTHVPKRVSDELSITENKTRYYYSNIKLGYPIIEENGKEKD